MGLDVQKITPVGFISQHTLKHRLGLSRRPKELDHLVNLVGDDGVKDTEQRYDGGRARVFGPLDGFASIRR